MEGEKYNDVGGKRGSMKSGKDLDEVFREAERGGRERGKEGRTDRSML